MSKQQALERGSWVADDGWTMEGYRREAANGKTQVVVRSPGNESWGLFVEGYEMFRHKSIFVVLRNANWMGQQEKA